MIEHNGFLRVDVEMLGVDEIVRDEEMDYVGGYW